MGEASNEEKFLTACLKPKDPKFFRKILKQSSKILDLALIKFNKDEVSIGGFDESFCVLYCIKMKKNAFKSYKVDLEDGKEVQAIIRLDFLNRFLSRHPPNNDLELYFKFEPYTKKSGLLDTCIRLESLGDIKKTFKMTIREEYEWKKRPVKIEKKYWANKVKAHMDLRTFFEFVDDSTVITSDVVSISVENKSFELYSEESILSNSSYSVVLPESDKLSLQIDESDQKLTTHVALEYLRYTKQALYGDEQPLFDKLFLSWGFMSPLYIIARDSSVEAEILIAPRVQKEEEKEEDDDEDFYDDNFDDDEFLYDE